MTSTPAGTPTPLAHPNALLMGLAGTTIFLGAFLLFQVQPLIGKAILPRFGGSAAVWTTCMLFFQGMLLAGYLYAHASVTSLSPAWQRRVHFALLLASLAALPITPDPASAVPADLDPSLAILATLAASVGLPYFLLSTTGPLLQAWITQLRPGAVPYRLFALSNLASLLALVTYPVAVEPFLPLRLQDLAWSGAFVAFVLACAAMAWLGAPHATRREGAAARHASPAPGWTTWLAWLLLAACPSVLLLAITNHLTQDIAPVPFLWIVPLVLYLLSFILCFEQRSWYVRWLFLPLAAVALVAMDWQLGGLDNADKTVRIVAPLFAAGLFVCCMACHGELARSKPAPDRLTGFYLAVSVGGVMGGVLVGVVAPRVFDGFHELPLSFIATAACLAWVLLRDGPAGGHDRVRLVTLALLAIAPVVLAVRTAERLAEDRHPAVWQARNFFGTLKLRDAGEGADAYRSLIHAGTDHGGQFTSADRRREPTSYYAPESGVALAIADAQSRGRSRVGVIGLGTGTLAAYSRPGDEYVFYDINPLVAEMARLQFTYLGDAKGSHSIVMGDARLSLEQQAPQRYDVLVLDAFSGDSIPIHLLTAQAFAEYLRHLGPSGVLAVHTSNRYLDLHPVVKAAAQRFVGPSVLVQSAIDEARKVNAATWILLTPPGHPLLRKLETESHPAYAALPAGRLWPDDYSSVLTAMRAWKQVAR